MTAQIIPFPGAKPPPTKRQRIIAFLEGEGLTPVTLSQMPPAQVRGLVRKWKLSK